MKEERILFASPVRCDAPILARFLHGAQSLERSKCKLDFMFIDDNVSRPSSQLLHDFASVEEKNGGRVVIERTASGWGQNSPAHCWPEPTVWKVAAFKDRLIQSALKGGYSSLFLVDADVVVDPGTLTALRAAESDAISEIYWTSWKEGESALPQVWLTDEYTMYDASPGERLSELEKEARRSAFLARLRVPGVYEVGGLGGCTLLSRRLLEAGASFRRLPNLSFWGEDRHFCVRVAALGFTMHVDTHLPARHIYREADLGTGPLVPAQSGEAEEPARVLAPAGTLPSLGADVVEPTAGGGPWVEGLTVTSFDVQIGLRASQSGLLERLLECLPPGWQPTASPVVRRLYSLQIQRSEYILYADHVEMVRTRSLERMMESLVSDLDSFVADTSPNRVFIHAGAVGWRGQSIVFPGAGFVGKSTLVRELLDHGATYYSDEFAVLDEDGRVHPYARPLRLWGELGKKQVLGGCAGTTPLAIGMVVVSDYQAGVEWNPEVWTRGQGVLALLHHAAAARRRPAQILSLLPRALERTLFLQGPRGEARATVQAILHRLDSHLMPKVCRS